MAAFGYALYCRVQAVRHRQNGVEPRKATALNPLLLTQRGRAYRTRYHLALMLGFLAILVGLFTALLAIAPLGMF